MHLYLLKTDSYDDVASLCDALHGDYSSVMVTTEPETDCIVIYVHTEMPFDQFLDALNHNWIERYFTDVIRMV